MRTSAPATDWTGASVAAGADTKHPTARKGSGIGYSYAIRIVVGGPVADALTALSPSAPPELLAEFGNFAPSLL